MKTSPQCAQPSLGHVALIATFITALVVAQLTASKVLAFTLPINIPITGNMLLLPGAALAYALTYLATDCYNELYGKQAAKRLVTIGFGMNFLLLALVWSTIAAPAAPAGVDADMFATVLGSSSAIITGSLLAYLISQHWDVYAFHWLKTATNGNHLWLRNIGSTATSQAIDTIIFVSVGFLLAPLLLGVGQPLPTAVLLQLIIGQYLLKLGIAILDTPAVYLLTSTIRRYEPETTTIPVTTP